MIEKSQQSREEAEKHNTAFDEDYEKGDSFGAAMHARDAIAADIKADALYRVEHPEVERLDRLNSRVKEVIEMLSYSTYLLIGIFVLLCVITYKLL